MRELAFERSERNKVFSLGKGKKRWVFHCKPIHYKHDNRWRNIEINLREEPDKFITDRNKVSVGFRKDGKLEKYIGLRYDYDHQFETTFREIKVDGVEKTSISDFNSLSKETKSEIGHTLASGAEIVTKLTFCGVKNFVKVPSQIDNFKLVEEIHLKGLTCSNQKVGNEYVADDRGRFNIVDENGELKFWIKSPYFVDASGERSNNIIATLSEIGGRLFYTKIPTKRGKDDLLLAQYPILIDTNVYYSSTSDGWINRTNGYADPPEENNTWQADHDAAIGDDGADDDAFHAQAMMAENHFDGKAFITRIVRTFLCFDTSDLDGETITSATLKLFEESGATEVVSAQEGTQTDPLDFVGYTDYDEFTGTEFGHATMPADDYCSISFNTLGKSKINKTGTTKICCREYVFDYSDADPLDGVYVVGIFFSDEDGTTKDPKLEVDIEGGAYRRRVIVTG